MGDPSVSGTDVVIDSTSSRNNVVTKDTVDGDVFKESCCSPNALCGKILQEVPLIVLSVIGKDLVQVDVAIPIILVHVASSNLHDPIIDDDRAWFRMGAGEGEILQASVGLGGDVIGVSDVDVLDTIVVMVLASQHVHLAVDGSGLEVVSWIGELRGVLPIAEVCSQVIGEVCGLISISILHSSNVVQCGALQCQASTCSDSRKSSEVLPRVVDGVVSPSLVGGTSGMGTLESCDHPDVAVQLVWGLIQERNGGCTLAVTSIEGCGSASTPLISAGIIDVDSVGGDQRQGVYNGVSKASHEV